jgi:outer membrane protein TolC
MRRHLFFLVVFCAVPPCVSARELTLAEALSAAEKADPALEAARQREASAQAGVGVADSARYPVVSADAVDSWGFPGSSGALGLGGLVGSPYRSGAAAGLVARDTLYDFGRTAVISRTARQEREVRRQETELERRALDLDVLRAFEECSRFRSGREVWDRLHGETELVAREIARYVTTGQRSVVDRYLSDAQVEEARTNRNYFGSRMRSTLKRLALLTALPASDLTCPAMPPLDQAPVPSAANGPDPFVLRAQSEVELAKTRLAGAKDDYLPKLYGVASVGTMERARLVNKEDWSGGLGVTVPLFDGFGTESRVKRARADLEARARDLDAARVRVAETDDRYDEVIDSSKARLEHLARELSLAQEGFRVAKDRYFKYQGTLADMRDALRNLGRIENDMAQTQADLLEAVGEKALVDGGRP